MNVNIREYIKNNFKDSNANEIRESIEASIESNDEVVLPGLGVLFEILWCESEDNTRKEILNYLKNGMTK